MLQERKIRRDVAQRISVAGILNGNFQENEYGASTLNVNGNPIRRINLLATVVAKNDREGQKSLVVDDGTGQIRLRFFENDWQFGKSEIGDFVLIIGRLRRFGAESYVVPEILKPVKDVKWADARRLELMAKESSVHAVQGETAAADVADATVGAVVQEENLGKSEGNSGPDIVSKEKVEIYSIIKSLDSGRGADMVEVISKAGSRDAERLIREMLKSGDLFEALPGRLKVLE